MFGGCGAEPHRKHTQPSLESEGGSGVFDIGGELCREGFDSVEALLAPEEVDKLDSNALAIEIPAEVEQVGFEE